MFADTGWQEYAVLLGKGLQKRPGLKPGSHLLSVFGAAGRTAGGHVVEACLFAMKMYGRVACCGAVSQYDGAASPHGRRRLTEPPGT